MAQVAGAIIVSIVVSKAVSTLGPKLGLSESTSNLLGTAAGMYAGGMVGGGSTGATSATAGATTSQVGTDIPTGYGGESNIAGTPLAAGGAPPGGTPSDVGLAGPARAPTVNPALSRGALSAAMQAPPPGAPAPMQAPTTIESGGVVGKPGAGIEASEGAISRTPSQEGLLRQGQTTSSATTAQPAPSPDTASQVIDQTLVPKTEGGSGDTNWWKRMFTPEKTMDLAMAAMQGYGEAGMAKDDREYADKVDRRDADEWGRAYGTRVNTLNQSYPSGYGGP